MEKAKILVLSKDGKKKSEIKVMFNPSEYSIDSRLRIPSKEIRGTNGEITQFNGSSSDTLSVELFFDTYTKRNKKDKNYKSVRDYTQKIKNLLKVTSEDHAPPICLFIWGNLYFKGYIESLNEKFTMFSDKGIPLRAHLSVTFKSVKNVQELLKEFPPESADRTKARVLKDGEQLWSIAQNEYGDSSYWRVIADANNINNPRKVKAGANLVVPSLE